MKRLLPLISVLVLLLFAASPGSASPLCTDYADLHQYVCYDTFPATAGEFSIELALPKFNPALGTLVQIDFNLSAHIAGSATLTNRNATSKNYSVTLGEDVTLVDPNMVVVAETIPIFTDARFTVAANSSGTLPGSADASDPGITMTSPFSASERATYIGSGDIYFSVVTEGRSGFTGAGSTDFTSTVYTNGRADVIYTYVLTEIPEPATMFLIGSSLLALGFTRKLKMLSA